MLNLAAAALLAALSLPAAPRPGSDLAAPPPAAIVASCDAHAILAALAAGGLKLIGAEPLGDSGAGLLLIDRGGRLGVMFLYRGCVEHAPDGNIVLHDLGVPVEEVPAP